MKNHLTLSLFVACAVTVATPTYAASHFMKGMITNYDLNGDGRVTSEEYGQVRISRFAATDKNGNGTISPAEYLSEFEVRLESMLKASEINKTNKALNLYREIDRNLDHVITREEYVHAAEAYFSRQDANSDGFLNKADSENRNFGQVMKKYDANGNNEVTLEEFSKIEDAAFLSADTSKNGLLSKIEYIVAAENEAVQATKSSRDSQIKQTDIRFKSVDTNEDQIMTWEEYEASGSRMFNRLDTNKDHVLDDTDPAPKRRNASTAQNDTPANAGAQVASNDRSR